MDAQTQEQSWQLALAQQQQAAASAVSRQTQAPSNTSPVAQIADTGLQIFTRNVILQPLAIDALGTFGIATFGLSWIGLVLYTLIKDLICGISGSLIADPGDLLYFAIPQQTLQKMPRWFRDSPRIPMRLLIYPMGMFVCMIYATLIFAMLFPYLMIAGILGNLGL